MVMRIKKFNDFINEEVSGTELVGSIGPAYGETRLQNKTISQTDTSLVNVKDAENSSSKNDLTKDLFFEDDYIKLHNDYLKEGGLESDLTGNYEQDLGTIMDFLRSSEL
jgi:hypothetical protein